MPAEYKYEFISLGRSKALVEAANRAARIHKEIKDSKIFDPAFMERFRIMRLLLNHAAGHPTDRENFTLLDELLGKDMGEEKQ